MSANQFPVTKRKTIFARSLAGAIRPRDVASCLAGVPQRGDEVEQERLQRLAEPAIMTAS
jgi:hypothetical protein